MITTLILAMVQLATTQQPVDADAAALAHRIAIATFQPDRALADGLANFGRQFDASTTRAAAGRTMSAAQAARLRRIKAAGRAAIERAMRSDAIPAAVITIEREYQLHYDAAELRQIATFWESPAGSALTAQFQTAALSGTTQTTPPEFATDIAQYFATPAGRKENARGADTRARLVSVMEAAMARVLTKADAAMSTAATAP